MAMRGNEENAGSTLQDPKDLDPQQDHGRGHEESRMDLDTDSNHEGGASSQGSSDQRPERVDDKVLDSPTGEY